MHLGRQRRSTMLQAPAASVEDKKGVLSRQQHYPASYQKCSYPAAVINPFMQEDLGGHGVGHESEGSGGGSHQAHVRPGEGKKQAEKRHGHHENSHHEAGTPQDVPHYRGQPGAAPEISHIAYFLHGAGEQHVPSGGGQDNHHDCAPGVSVFHGSTLEPTGSTSLCG